MVSHIDVAGSVLSEGSIAALKAAVHGNVADVSHKKDPCDVQLLALYVKNHGHPDNQLAPVAVPAAATDDPAAAPAK